MAWLVYLVGAIVIAVSSFMVGAVMKERQLGKLRKHVLTYLSLTPKSKRLVDGYMQSRVINDERTTYRERK